MRASSSRNQPGLNQSGGKESKLVQWKLLIQQ